MFVRLFYYISKWTMDASSQGCVSEIRKKQPLKLQPKLFSPSGFVVSHPGDSTGGNLAAATALHVAKTPLDHPLLRYQVLICPMLQALDYQLPSYSDNDGLLPILTTKHAGGYASIYLGLGRLVASACGVNLPLFT